MNLWFNMRPAALVVCTPPKRGMWLQQQHRRRRRRRRQLAHLSRAHNFFRLSANQKAICRAGSHRGRESKIVNIRASERGRRVHSRGCASLFSSKDVRGRVERARAINNDRAIDYRFKRASSEAFATTDHLRNRPSYVLHALL